MSDFLLYLGTAFALVFVIEGLIYALFPGGVRKMLLLAVSLPPEKLRGFGLLMTAIGGALIWGLHLIFAN